MVYGASGRCTGVTAVCTGGPGTALGAALGTMFLSFGNAFMFGGLLATLPSQERFSEFENELLSSKSESRKL